MTPMKRFLLALVLLVSVASASKVWEFDTDGEVYLKPVVLGSNIVIASDDGKIYALSPMTGAKQWEMNIGEVPNGMVLFDGGLVVSTPGGMVKKVSIGGNEEWSANLNTTPHNASYIFGIDANDDTVFVSANNGILMLDANGDASRLNNFPESTLTPPAAGSNYVIFGRGDELLKVAENGVTIWTTGLDRGSFWQSAPVIQGGVVYIGALDDRMHAYALSNGIQAWEAWARNWILSTPLVEGGSVYFGSNDGNVYAVDVATGQPRWKAETQLAVQSQPESGFMGGQEVVFVGSTDKNIYAISRDSGDVLWKGPAEGAVGGTLFYQNIIIAGSQSGKVTAHSTERACSITSPVEGQLVGNKELVVTGKYVSESGDAIVYMNINGGQWLEANTSDVDWTYYLNPSQSLGTGLNTISCLVSDAAGQESGPDFTSVSINYDPTMEPSDLVVRTPSSIAEGGEFTVYVNDGDDGSPVERFDWTLDGRDGTSDRNITLTLSEPGTYELTVSKIGFKDEKKTIEVYASGVNPIFIVVGGLLILIIIWQVWSRVISKRFIKKKRR
ncbi:PQQ-binding-like beta-propeller repeat protein [Candidatus Micrarchaeota archaeon]|nr:PQQ-binding-like beta-propeller repeat protein [Candidatus Micrarchaeota archaeon]